MSLTGKIFDILLVIFFIHGNEVCITESLSCLRRGCFRQFYLGFSDNAGMFRGCITLVFQGDVHLSTVRLAGLQVAETSSRHSTTKKIRRAIVWLRLFDWKIFISLMWFL
uniref:Secreted protein n=1 Tax=Rhipicephalus zambeziensis TaxID=60191 RepID=A0A224YKI9_9ACAR